MSSSSNTTTTPGTSSQSAVPSPGLPARPRATSQGTIKPSAKQAVAEVFRAAGLSRDLGGTLVAGKYEKRVFTPKLVPVADEDEEKKKDSDDEHDEEYHDSLPHLPSIPAGLRLPARAATPSSSSAPSDLPNNPPFPHARTTTPTNDRASGLYTFFNNHPSSSSTTTTSPGPGTVTTTISADPGPVRPSTARRLVSSVRRHLDMRPVREAFSSSGRIGRLLRRSGRDVGEIVAPAASGGERGEGEVEGEKKEKEKKKKEEGEATLARRLFGKKKPKRPKVPEGWLFGPPPE